MAEIQMRMRTKPRKIFLLKRYIPSFGKKSFNNS